MEFALFFLIGLSLGLFAGYFFNREREKDLLDRLTPDYLMMRNFSESNRQASKKWNWPDLPFLKKKIVVPVPAARDQIVEKAANKAQDDYREMLKTLHEQGVPLA